MSTKTIPQQTIKTCDCCGVTMDRRNSRQRGALVLKADALDIHGHPCADATTTYDLCDACLHHVGEAVGAALVSARAIAVGRAKS